MVTSFLHQEVMDQLVEQFDKTCKNCLRSDWIGKHRVLAFFFIKKYAFSIACDMFASMDDPIWQAMILREFNNLLKGGFQLPIYIPGTRHYNAVKAAEVICRELIKVKERKREMRLLSDKEIADNTILLMDFGHDARSSAMMMLMKFLAEIPDCFQRILEGCIVLPFKFSYDYSQLIKMQSLNNWFLFGRAKGNSCTEEARELLNKNDIQKMKYSRNVISEVLRFSPPEQRTFRKAKVEFTYAGFSIPKNWMSCRWTARNTHSDAQYFPNPDKFDPERFEGDTITPYSFIPFGGGPRMCPGKRHNYSIFPLLVDILTKIGA